MHDLVARSTIVVAPSRMEGFGLTALEAALMARPAIVAGTGGLPEAVADGVTGLVVPCDDVAALAGAVRHLLRSPEVARRMGRAGRRRALTVFGAERQVDDWDALYRRFVDDERRDLRWTTAGGTGSTRTARPAR
jgi:glycosyltransferase involved in cell wall biosynthesis